MHDPVPMGSGEFKPEMSDNKGRETPTTVDPCESTGATSCVPMKQEPHTLQGWEDVRNATR